MEDKMSLAVGILLIIVGLGMILFWARHMATGGLPQGIQTLESGGYIAFHITAELTTGTLCILGGVGLALAVSCGAPVALFASGMLAYTGVNSLAWKEVKNRPALSAMFIVPTLIAIISGVYLIAFVLT
jgi:hypothetical protein